MNWTISALALVIASVIVVVTERILKALPRKKPDGAIVINTDDPEKDTYTLELYIPFGELDNRKDVKFQIIHHRGV